ncbi:MAG: Hpt domain-containing protein, partial [Desulfobulbus sp.]|nr:Hpt domain-containing protein [Desulfobulbus sp.]
MTLSPNGAASSHLDSTVLDNLRRQMPGQPDILVRIIHSFLRASPDLLAALQAAIRARDPEAVRQAAHAMKSSNGQIGANQLAAMCYELELLGSLGQLL